MDKQGTQRIIGVMVIVALAIVVFPLLFGKNEITTTQKSNIEAPPFPDHAAPLAEAATPQQQDAPVTAITDANSPVAVVTPSATPTTASNQIAPIATVVVPDTQAVQDTQNPIENNSTVSQDAKPHVESIANQEIATPTEKAHPPVTSLLSSTDEKSTQGTHKKSKTIVIKKAILSKAKPEHNKQKELVKLQNVAWAVQMGSFKDKNNAVRLADKLRVAGFKAFTREVKATKGHPQTRVYIGPEFKMANAVKLSSKVQNRMQLSGIVVVYKPLSL